MSIVIIEGTPPEPTDPAPTVIISYQGPPGPSAVTTATLTNIDGVLKGNGVNIAEAIAGTDFEAPIAPGTTGQYWRGDKTWQTLPNGATNLSVTGQTATGLTVASDTGTDAAIPQATGSLAGLQSAADKAKEDVIWNIGPDIASAATMDIGASTGDIMNVTGNTGITAFTSAPAGVRKKLIFGSTISITHNATSLIMPNGANVTLVAGSCLEFLSLGSGNWRCTSILNAPLEITAKSTTPTLLAIQAGPKGSAGTGATSYTIPRADATHAGIISAAEWTVLSGISGVNTGDQSLSLGTVGASTVAVNLSGGTSATVPAATASAAGVATAAQITKLDGIDPGAEVNVNADWNAVSGDAQILNKPTIPAAQVNSDWTAVSGVAQILNKPTLGTAAALNVPTSGDAASGEVVKGSDTRLSNARTPTAHTHPVSDLTAGSAVLGDVLTFNGTNYAPAAPSDGSPTRSIKVATSDGQSVFTGFDNDYLDGLQEWTLWGTSLPPAKITATDGTTATLDAAFAAEVLIGDELRCLSWGAAYSGLSAASRMLWIIGDTGSNDQSSNATANDAAKTANSIGAGATVNGHASLSFNGTSSYIKWDNATNLNAAMNADGWSFIAVLKSASSDSGASVCWNNSASNYEYGVLKCDESSNSNKPDIYIQNGIGTSYELTSTHASTIAVWHVYRVRRSGSTLKLSIDGGAEETLSASFISSNNRFSLGALIRPLNPSGVVFDAMDLAEVTVCNSSPTIGELDNEVSSLKLKYGIA